MQIERVILRQLNMEMKHAFATSYGSKKKRPLLIVEVHTAAGAIGWGECAAFDIPWYTEESLQTAWHVLEDFLIPTALGEAFLHPDSAFPSFSIIRRHHMAKAALEGAIWDAYAKEEGLSLAQALGGVKQEVEVGVSIGMQANESLLKEKIEEALACGYRRVKIKIGPGSDLAFLEAVRRSFPSLPLMADANSSYTLSDLEHIKRFDAYGLLMLEQPLAYDDIIDHAELQSQLRTPICLDESINSAEDVRKAIQIDAMRILNIKAGRLGGLSEAVRAHDACAAHGIPVWCGGMLEAGIGRAHAIALSSLPGFALPGDTAGSDRYWERDIIEPAFRAENGLIRVPQGLGIGVEPDVERMEALAVRHLDRWLPL